jgi:hypothetical protein
MEGLSVEIIARDGNFKTLLSKFRLYFSICLYLLVVGRFMRYSEEFTDRCKSLNREKSDLCTGWVREFPVLH